MNTSKFSALALPTSPAPGPIGRGTPSRNSHKPPTRAQTFLNAASARMFRRCVAGSRVCSVYVHTCFHTATAAGARARVRVRASERTKIDEREDAS